MNMVQKITTQFGHPTPPEVPHAITAHIPGWNLINEINQGDISVFSRIKSIYPRFGLFFQTKELSVAITKALGFANTHAALPFAAPDSVRQALEFALSSARGDFKFFPEDGSVRVIDIDDVRLYVIVFPLAKTPGIIEFWQHPGLGVSTRLAEDLTSKIHALKDVTNEVGSGQLPEPTYLPVSSAHKQLRERIASLLNRARREPNAIGAASDDVYLFQSGMASLYRPHIWLTGVFKAQSVLLGCACHSTEEILKHYGAGFHPIRRGGSQGLVELNKYLIQEERQGRKVQAVYLEFPSNPLLTCTSLVKLRELAHIYNFVLVVDDTIGSFCNIDVLPYADVLSSSLTKSFSGYANLLAGSAVLNPNSPKYKLLKECFERNYHNEFYARDAEVLLRNSEDYLARSAILSNNANAVIRLLKDKVDDVNSCVTALYYPSVLPDSVHNYQEVMRLPTVAYTPGYGTVFSVEFRTIEQTQLFYDSIELHKGTHFGAPVTLALPYNLSISGRTLELIEEAQAAGCFLTQVRIAVGQENQQELLDVFHHAFQIVDRPAQGS